MNIWEATLDDVYQIYVIDNGQQATLYLERDGVVLAEKNVHLSYGAIFGPDFGDVHDWTEWAVDIVDNQLQA